MRTTDTSPSAADHTDASGSHLARFELKIALEELHKRIPAYSVVDGAELEYSPGIREIRELPLVFEPEVTIP